MKDSECNVDVCWAELVKVWFTDSEPPSASHHMSSARWEDNYRKERKTLSGLPPCSDFPCLLSFKTFTWFSRQIPHRGERSACQAAALFRLDQKTPPPPGSPSLLLYFLSFCHLPVVFPCCAHFGEFFTIILHYCPHYAVSLWPHELRDWIENNSGLFCTPNENIFIFIALLQTELESALTILMQNKTL